jgi:hypothetical protein
MPYFETYVTNPLVEENAFLGMAMDESPLPAYAEVKHLLPRPHWEGHEAALACYQKVWEIAFGNLRRPTEENGFVANYIDTAFNDHLFMWDSAFILMFARYGARAFDSQRTLDNLYAKQHPDGFICREVIESNGLDLFCRFDPPSTGPNVLPWAEWEHWQSIGDVERLARVFPVLVAYHQWLRAYRTWPDGSYWTCGWGCGMDNQPRTSGGQLHAWWYHDHLSWIDACLQQVLSARLLLQMADVVGRSDEVADLRREIESLSAFINDEMWDESTAFYYDRHADGSLSDVKTIGAYWALLADVLSGERLARFVAHLEDAGEFNRPHRVPALSADDPAYRADGGYWCGGVWAPTNYMVLRGLTQVGYDELAHEIGLNHVNRVAEVFERTGTVWENYAPEEAAPGQAKGDFVGWTGLPPVAVLFEYVFGLRPDVAGNRLVWDVRLLEGHGVEGYPFGADGLLTLRCAARSRDEEQPQIEVHSNVPLTLEIRWADGVEERSIMAEG